MPVGTARGGGAEQILSILERGLVEQGHQSVVVAASGSKTAGALIETAGFQASSEDHRAAIAQALREYSVDLIHFHGLDFYEYVPEREIPMLATLHLPLSFYPACAIHGGGSHRVMLNCVSQNQVTSDPIASTLAVIPNGIRTEDYAPQTNSEFLLWLGRICPEKGVHIALEVAHRLDATLIVAGPIHPYSTHQEYFCRYVKPLLDERRTYIGPVDLEAKKSLLARAYCVLVPSLVAETSSLVAMEALSSGTPVVAFRRGALPEIIEDNRTGFIVDSAEEMAQAVCEVSSLCRAECRAQAIRRFDWRRMARDYLDLYGRITTRHLSILRAPHESL
jgi:glycosyltransferase involved in cell wall biosynthesis